MGKVENAAEEYHNEFDDCMPSAKESFLAGAKWQSENPEWISVKERLPEIGELVLIFVSTETYFLARLKHGNFFSYGEQQWRLNEVSHWKELMPPKELEEK